MLNLRTRLAIALALTAMTLPLTAQEDEGNSPGKCCNDLSLEVFERTGDRALSDMVFHGCDEEWCIEWQKEREKT